MAAETLPADLVREGELMLAALLADLAEIPAMDIVALRDARLDVPGGLSQGIEWIALNRNADAARLFAEQVAHCDAAWPIAPETGGILERLCRLVEAAGKGLLNSPAAAVRIAASKLATVRRLEAHGVPVVATMPLDGSPPVPKFPLVAKPDDGVGCEGTRVLETAEAWREFLGTLQANNYLVQPWVEGEALSLSALFADGEAKLLSINRQHIVRENGGFALKACGVNAVNTEFAQCEDLAGRIAAALPELWGYAGVDLIRTQNGPRVLEINPRLTTSYAGLAASTGLNPAELVLNLWRQGSLPKLDSARRQPVDIVLEPHHGY